MINIPDPASSFFVLIDMQEKLLPAMHDPESCLNSCKKLVSAAAAMNIPGIVTEQYPKGLGSTVELLRSILPASWNTVAKSAFSCFCEPAFRQKIPAYGTLILFGIESHVCVTQTALDALNACYKVCVIRDAVSSRKTSDRDAAFDFLTACGVQLLTTEMILFELLRDSKHPAFKVVSALIK